MGWLFDVLGISVDGFVSSIFNLMVLLTGFMKLFSVL